MPCDFHCEAIAKFLIPNRPQEDNYLDHDEFEEKEKEWEEKRDLALVQCTVWVEREQVVEAKCAAEATCCRQDIGSWKDLPPGPRFKGMSMVSTILSKEG